MKAIINANVVLEDKILENGVILFEEGIIIQADQADRMPYRKTVKNRVQGCMSVRLCRYPLSCRRGCGHMMILKWQLSTGKRDVNQLHHFHDIGEDGAIEAMKKIRSAMER